MTWRTGREIVATASRDSARGVGGLVRRAARGGKSARRVAEAIAEGHNK